MTKGQALTIGETAFLAVLLTIFGNHVAHSGPELLKEAGEEQEQLPVNQVISAVGTAAPEEGPYDFFEATAYCDFGRTFSGVVVQRGIVAADPEILPIGSVIEVLAGDYSGIYTVMDTGGLVKGDLIDIYMPEYEEAIQFGRRKVKLRVLRYGWLPDSDLGLTHTAGAG
jgi:3D (Asp-Asp-Asp) domain-containing protein